MSAVEIRPATVRDVSYVAANLRAEDAREIYCQMPAEADAMHLTMVCLAGEGLAWCAHLGRRPVMAFGAAPASHCGTVWSAWAFGTRRMRKAVPAVSRFGREVLAGKLLKRGARRLEVRSIEGHDLAHRWLEGLGARREARLEDFGRNGEAFVLWSWTRARWRAAGGGAITRPPSAPAPCGHRPSC